MPKRFNPETQELAFDVPDGFTGPATEAAAIDSGDGSAADAVADATGESIPSPVAAAESGSQPVESLELKVVGETVAPAKPRQAPVGIEVGDPPPVELRSPRGRPRKDSSTVEERTAVVKLLNNRRRG